MRESWANLGGVKRFYVFEIQSGRRKRNGRASRVKRNVEREMKKVFGEKTWREEGGGERSGWFVFFLGGNGEGQLSPPLASPLVARRRNFHVFKM